MGNRLIIMSFFLLMSQVSWGQSAPHWAKTIRFSPLRAAIQDSLDQKKVLCLLRDQQGSTWFGTRQGLLYYNGQELITIKDTIQDGTPLSSMVIQTLFEDTQGDIWLGTKNYGAVRFSSVTRTFYRYNLEAEFPAKRNVHSVLSYCKSTQKKLWVGTFGGGIFYYDSLQNNFSPLDLPADSGQTIATSVIMDLHEDKQGMLWAATFGNGLLRYDPFYKTLRQYVPTPVGASVNISDLTALEEDGEGTLWVGTFQSGLIQYNRQTETFYHPVSTLSDNHIQDMHFHNETLWVATQGQGLFCYDIQKEEVHQFVHHRNDPYSLADNHISTTTIDNYGTLWAVGKSKVSTALVVGFDFSFLSDSTEVQQPITALTPTQDESIWFGTANALLYQWNNQTKTLTNHTIDAPGNNQLLSPKIITALAEDRERGLWVGMSDGTLVRWNPSRREWKTYLINDRSNNLVSDGIESIYQDRKGNLWIGVLEKGLYLWNRKTDRIESAAHLFQSVPTTFTPKAYAENEQYLWVGTLKNGLLQLHYSTGKIVHYKNLAEAEENNLPSNQITGLALDGSGFLWVGTFDQGVGRLSTRSGTWTPFTENEGLVSNRVTSVLSGPNSEIWIGTLKGLSCYNEVSRHIRNYASSEFMQDAELVQYCAVRDDKNYYFGTLNGIIQITSTAKAPQRSTTLPLIATRLTTSRRSIQLTSPRETISRIELPYDENALEIDYILQHFPFQTKHQYEYRLRGLDEQWKPVGTRTLATYTNLHPGVYQFQIKAISSQNEVAETAPLLIIIHPAWYQTLWFKVLVALAVILLFSLLYYYRILSVKKRNRILEELVAERTRELVDKNRFIEQQHQDITLQNQQLEEAKAVIDHKNNDLILLNEDLEKRVEQRTQELAQTNEALRQSNAELDLFVYRAYHDIIGPIARIEGLCQVASMEVKGQPIVDGYLSKLLDNCRVARTSLQKVLQIHHVRHHVLQYSLVNLHSFISELYQKTASLFAEQPILPQFYLECDDDLHLEADTELLALALQSFLKNAIQYSLLLPDSYVRVTVEHSEEQGTQITVDDNGEGILAELHDKLFTMFFRGHETKSGTGLDLYIAQLSAERLQGTVEYHPDLDHTRFKLIFPVLSCDLPQEERKTPLSRASDR
ncbi:MAG: two-component regulator propeller domain-containing protein [Bacteroidota bacterium]